MYLTTSYWLFVGRSFQEGTQCGLVMLRGSVWRKGVKLEDGGLVDISTGNWIKGRHWEVITCWLREVGRGERKEKRGEQVTGRSGGEKRNRWIWIWTCVKGKKLQMIKIYSIKWQSSHSKSLPSHCISHNPLLHCPPPPTPTGEFFLAILKSLFSDLVFCASTETQRSDNLQSSTHRFPSQKTRFSWVPSTGLLGKYYPVAESG